MRDPAGLAQNASRGANEPIATVSAASKNGALRLLFRRGGLTRRGVQSMEGRDELPLVGAGAAHRQFDAPGADRDDGTDFE